MHRIDTVNVANVRPLPGAVGSSVGYFQNANPELDQEPTKLDADFFNALQEAIVRTIIDSDGGNMTLDKDDDEQLKNAIKVMIAANTSGESVLFMNRKAPEYVSATQVKIPAGFRCRDKTNAMDLVFSTDQIVAINTPGANGLDIGTVGNNNKYYLHAIGDSNGVNPTKGLFSLSRTTPTLPSGYNKSRPLPVVWRTNGSTQITRMVHFGGFPQSPIWMYDLELEPFTDSTHRVLNGGAATTLTIYDPSAYIPSESRVAFLQLAQKGNMVRYHFSDSASGGGMYQSHQDETRYLVGVPLNNTQQGYYSVASASVYASVAGYQLTEEFDS